MAKSNDPVRIGIIGCGNLVEKHHLPVLRTLRDANVVAVATAKNRKRLHRVADAFQIKKRFTDYRMLLRDPSVEAVSVSVPVQSHFEIALSALNAKKHLLLEKPITFTLDEADRLIQRAAETDRKILVGFNNRWLCTVRRTFDILQKGLLGSVKIINSVHSSSLHNQQNPEWRPKRNTGGGSLFEKGSHIYDLWWYFLRSEIDEVRAVSHSTPEFDDKTAIVTARTVNGVFLNCVLSDCSPDRQEIEILGQDCALHLSLRRFDGLQFIPLSSYSGDIRSRARNISSFLKEMPRGIRQAFHGGEFQESFRTQWQHFINCIRNDRAVECTLEDGRRSLQIALASVESASTGKAVKAGTGARNVLPVVY